MKNKKTIYYKDELNDEFSTAQITPITIDENYKYKHGKTWDTWSFIIQNILSIQLTEAYIHKNNLQNH